MMNYINDKTCKCLIVMALGLMYTMSASYAGTHTVENIVISNTLSQTGYSVTNVFSGDLNCGNVVRLYRQGDIAMGSYTSGVKPGVVEALSTAASDLAPDSATLNGLLSSIAYGEGSAWIYWGTNDGATVKDSWQNNTALGIQQVGEVSTAVTGLSVGVTYYYRLYASNDMGMAWADSSTNFLLTDDVSDIVLEYLMGANGSESSVTLDTSGNDFTGTVRFAVFNQANNGIKDYYAFDGNADRIWDTNFVVGAKLGASVTSIAVSFSFFADVTSGNDGLFQFGATASDQGKLNGTVGSTGLRLRSGGTIAGDATVLDTSRWYHYYGVYDGADLILYLDGKHLADTAFTTALDMSSEYFNIGVYYAAANGFDGNMANFKVEATPPSAALVFTNMVLDQASVGVISDYFTNQVDMFEDNVDLDLEFNEGDQDSSTNHVALATASAPTYTGNATNGWAVFNGSANYLNVPSAGAPWKGSANWAIAFWINPADINNNDAIIDNQDIGEGDGSMAVYFNADDELRYRGSESGSAARGLLDSPALSEGVWTHFVISRNGASSSTMYQNGKIVDTDSSTYTNYVSTNTVYTIGRAIDWEGHRFDGSLGEYQAFSRGLTSTEATNLYDATKGQY